MASFVMEDAKSWKLTEKQLMAVAVKTTRVTDNCIAGFQDGCTKLKGLRNTA